MGTPLPFACACEERLGLSLAEFAELAKETALLFDETASYHGAAASTAALRQAVAALRRLHTRLETPLWKYRVGVAGLSASGTAALFSDILEYGVDFLHAGPWADTPFEFRYGDDWSVSVHRADGRTPLAARCGNRSDVAVRLKEIFHNNCAKPGMPADKIVVNAPIELLRNGLVVCDSPSYRRSARASEHSAPKPPEKSLHGNSVHLIWVARAAEIAVSTEMFFSHHPLAGQCSDVIVIDCDGKAESEAASLNTSTTGTAPSGSRLADIFGCLSPALHYVTHPSPFPETAALPVLAHRIRELADPDTRIKDAAAAWERLGGTVRAWLTRWKKEEGVGHFCWRPDSWARWVGVAAASPVGRAMAEALSVPYASGPEPISSITR